MTYRTRLAENCLPVIYTSGMETERSSSFLFSGLEYKTMILQIPTTLIVMRCPLSHNAYWPRMAKASSRTSSLQRILHPSATRSSRRSWRLDDASDADHGAVVIVRAVNRLDRRLSTLGRCGIATVLPRLEASSRTNCHGGDSPAPGKMEDRPRDGLVGSGQQLHWSRWFPPDLIMPGAVKANIGPAAADQGPTADRQRRRSLGGRAAAVVGN